MYKHFHVTAHSWSPCNIAARERWTYGSIFMKPTHLLSLKLRKVKFYDCNESYFLLL